jgi:phenylalanyl-tRNA synthetase beta chain
LIEEIGRLYGFENLPKSAARHTTSQLEDNKLFQLEKKTRSLLLQEGLQEFLTCDLISPFLASLLGRKQEVDSHCITVLHAKSQDYSLLRPSLMPGLLQVVKHNIDHQNDSIFGFEVGRVHFTEKNSLQEHPSAGIILSGNNAPYHHIPKPREVDFFDLKGILENLFDHLKIGGVLFEPSHLPHFQMGRQAIVKVEGKMIGMIGEIHPLILQTIDIKQRTYFAELNLEMLAAFTQKKITTKELSLYPSSDRDWTVTLTKHTPIGEVLNCIHSMAPALLKEVSLIDVFESEKIGPNHKNVTWRFVYQDKEKTIDAPTVEKVHTTLLQKVAQKLENCIL